MQQIRTFLMFEGNAGAAIDFYLSVFEGADIKTMTRYGANQGGVEGSVMHATVSIKGQEFIFIDGNISHGFTFTPAMSLFVTCETEEEIDKLYVNLSADGKVMMPLDAYPFSKKYGWVNDKFGLSWQLTFN